MLTPDPHGNGGGAHGSHDPFESRVHNHDERALKSIRDGYELTDVSVRGILVFLGVLGSTVLIFFVFAFGFGKVIDIFIRHTDGKVANQSQAGLSAPATVKGKGIVSSPVIEQQQLRQLTGEFPTPRLQTDDGDQDLADMHAREDLLLGHYSYIDAGAGRVRIPIWRAMELVAQRGLPVAPAATTHAASMYGETTETVRVPLTNGFARTGYEQERASATGTPGDQSSAKANDY
jgi:hypothetical protein